MSRLRILVVGIGFYNYEQAIIENLNARGYDVDYLVSVYRGKWMSLYNKLHCRRKIQNIYLSKKIRNITKTFDIILIIKGEGFNKSHIQQLKERCPTAKFVLYLWDSIDRLNNFNILKDVISDIFTFDRVDAIRYGLKFRPLFFLKSMTQIESVCQMKYDIFFLGWLHSDRYRLISEIKRQLDSYDVTYKFLIYTGRFKYFIERYIKKSIDGKDSKMFIFSPLSYEEYIKNCLQSNVILDISHPCQNGLTMRTIEAIGLGKKIITTNRDVQNYKNLKLNSFHIIDRNNPIIDLNFIKKRYVTNEDNVNHFFSLNTFVDDILPLK